MFLAMDYMIIACVDNNPDEKVTQRGMNIAPSYMEIQTLDYEIYINRSLPMSVNFPSGNCTTNSNQAVMCMGWLSTDLYKLGCETIAKS